MKIIDKIRNFIFDNDDEEKTKSKNKIVKEEKKEIQKEEKSNFLQETSKHGHIEDIIDEQDIPPKKRFDFEKDYFPEKPKKDELSREYLQTITYRKETKKFKPTPMISPVFGLIGEQKEEAVLNEQKEEKKISNFDKVRQKAYGTLTDEIEDTLTRLNKGNFYNPPKREGKKPTITDETIEIKTEVDSEETKEYNTNNDTEEKIKFETIDVEKEIKKDTEDDEDTKENDLYSLLETMYKGSDEKE